MDWSAARLDRPRAIARNNLAVVSTPALQNPKRLDSKQKWFEDQRRPGEPSLGHRQLGSAFDPMPEATKVQQEVAMMGILLVS